MEYSIAGEEMTSPRLMDTTLCPFSTTKKSIAHTYNNDTLYIASIDKDDDSIIQISRNKLKIRKIILDTAPDMLKQHTKRLLSRVGEADLVLEPLLKFQKSVLHVVKNQEFEIERLTHENSQLKSRLTHLPTGEESATSQPAHNYQNELQLKIQRLEATLKHFSIDQRQPNPQEEQRNSHTPNSHSNLSDSEKSSLMTALSEASRLREEKQNYSFIIANLYSEINRMKEEFKQSAASKDNDAQPIDDIQHLRQENEELRRYRELFYMCREEKESLELSMSMDLARMRNNEKQMKKLREKLMNMSSLVGKNDYNLLDTQEKDSIEKIKEQLINNVGFRKCTQQEFKMIQRYDNHNNDPLMEPSDGKYHDEMKIYYPNFFTLLTDEVKEFEVELKLSFNKAIPPDLFLRIRAILDSKHNQYTVEPIECCARFTDFVFGWFEKFEVSNETKRILQHSKPRIETEFNKKNFLVTLFNPKIEKLNEIITFREFLLNEAPEDEVFFYLECRSLLFKGNQLDHTSSTSDSVVFLQHDFVLKQVGLLIGKYPREVQNIIIYNINLRRKKKFNEYFIDVYFVLRTLLEVYRAHKRQKYEKMRLVMLKLQNTLGTNGIRFLYFRQLLELNFPKLPVSRIAFIFRETINVFKTNKIDFFGAFYAASHESLFISTTKEDLHNIHSNLHMDTKSMINVSATLPSAVGLESLAENFTQMFSDTLADLYTENLTLGKLIRLLAMRDDNKEYIPRLREKMRHENESKLSDIKAMSESIANRDNKVHEAATKLTRALRWKIKLYYDKFIDRINEKIDEVNNIR